MVSLTFCWGRPSFSGFARCGGRCGLPRLGDPAGRVAGSVGVSGGPGGGAAPGGVLGVGGGGAVRSGFVGLGGSGVWGGGLPYDVPVRRIELDPPRFAARPFLGFLFSPIFTHSFFSPNRSLFTRPKFSELFACSQFPTGVRSPPYCPPPSSVLHCAEASSDVTLLTPFLTAGLTTQIHFQQDRIRTLLGIRPQLSLQNPRISRTRGCRGHQTRWHRALPAIFGRRKIHILSEAWI